MLAPLLAAHPRLEIELDASNLNQNLLRRDADIALRIVRQAPSLRCPLHCAYHRQLCS